VVIAATTGGEVLIASTELGAVDEGLPGKALVEIVVSTPPGSKHTLVFC